MLDAQQVMKERKVLGFTSAAFREPEGDVAQVREPLKMGSKIKDRTTSEKYILVRYTFRKTMTGNVTDIQVISALANVKGKNGDIRQPVTPN